MKDIITTIVGNNPDVVKVILELIFIIFGILASKLTLKLKEKYKTELDDSKMYEILSLIRSVVTYINQTYVDKYKNLSDGKLDPDIADAAKDKAIKKINEFLTDEQRLLILSKYPDIDAFIELFIETAVKESKYFEHKSTDNVSSCITNLEPITDSVSVVNLPSHPNITEFKETVDKEKKEKTVETKEVKKPKKPKKTTEKKKTEEV